MVVPTITPKPRASTRTTRTATTTPASSASSIASTSGAPPGRLTRSTLRAATTAATTTTNINTGAQLTRTTTASSGLLQKSKESIRKVSDKIKEKEAAAAAARKAGLAPSDGYAESLQAFLRIRPPPTDFDNSAPAAPYLEIKNDKAVVMTLPPDNTRHHIHKPPHTYSFDRVFGPDAHQHEFFTTTTLPLVDKLLKGENGLMFAYGVSNSGKTYTIQGGNDDNGVEQRGVLPRSIDVVFNSIAGHESTANLKCQGLADVVLSDEPDVPLASLGVEPEVRITDTVTVDRNFSYAVFVSYAEVYNEKVFDLLDSVLPSARAPVGAGNLPRTMSMGVGVSGIGSNMSLAAMANGGAGILKRRALVLKNDPEGTGKYISGLNEIRVRTREEALAVFRSGQRARQVFGTMANRESSRSHGIFTLKVVRIHNGAPEDPESAQVSRLAIVDLAGSERTRNTASTGDRLKEAGNINKSLMVLGQCIEVLRANQQRMTTPSSLGLKRRLAVVPFRHSKLTEIFQSFFVGDGRAVMIVHVNPYDTGFDENSNVMKFSSIAQEISTVQTAPRTTFPTLKKQISSQFTALRNTLTGHGSGQKIKVMVPVVSKPAVTAVNVNASSSQSSSSHGGSSFARPTAASASRISSSNAAGRASAIPTPTAGRISRPPSRPPSRPISPQEAPTPSIDAITIVEEEIEVVEEEPEEEEDDDEHDYLVDYLFEELRQLKTQLYESEMRNATIEFQIREEVSAEMQETIVRMNARFNERLQQQNALGEEKADMKLDILQRVMAADEDGDRTFDHSFMTEADQSMSSATIGADASDADFFAPLRTSHASRATAETSFVSASEGNTTMDTSMDQSDQSMHSADESMDADSDSERDAQEADESLLDDSVDEINPRVNKLLVVSESESGSDSEDESDSDGADTTREIVRPSAPAPRITDTTNTTMNTTMDESDESGSEDAEGSELDDDEESGSEDEEDEEDDSEGSDFAEDDAEDDDDDMSVSSADTPPRPRPRRTVSPAKRGALASPAIKKTAPAKKPAPAPAAAKKPKPLRESNAQPLNLALVSDDDEVVKKGTPAKKKRTLGKKVVMEEEMAGSAPTSSSGAEVRRLVRG